MSIQIPIISPVYTHTLRSSKITYKPKFWTFTILDPSSSPFCPHIFLFVFHFKRQFQSLALSVSNQITKQTSLCLSLCKRQTETLYSKANTLYQTLSITNNRNSSKWNTLTPNTVPISSPVKSHL